MPHSMAMGVEYDGARFHGFQSQRHHATVQDGLESALRQIADEPVRITAAGRTDTGVHATQQVISFTTEARRTLEGWRRGITTLSPEGLGVVWCKQVPDGFNARFDATWRRYVYLIADTEHVPVIGAGQVLWQPGLDAAVMHQAAQCLIGEHDFSSFRAAGCQSKTPWRCIHAISVTRQGAIIVIDVTANAFLLRMVRNIVGTLIRIGGGELGIDDMSRLLKARDRTQAPPTAPPSGLYLVAVGYPQLPLEPRMPLLLRGHCAPKC